MSVLEIECPACQARYKVRAENVGKKARCSKCAEVFTVREGTPDRPPAVDRTRDELLVCNYCGFQDSGSFCSNCGGRISGQATYDFDSCKIPESFLARFSGDRSWGGRLGMAEACDDSEVMDVHARCREYSAQLEEMARVVRYEGADAGGWRFERVNVARMVDLLPHEVPGRDDIVAHLWIIISDIERAVATRVVTEHAADVRAAIDAGSVKKAEKAMEKLRGKVDAAEADRFAALLSELDSRIAVLVVAEHEKKRLAEFQKLLDKADKYAFMGDKKKAEKAYQECRFWLSRNELPNGAELRDQVEGKLGQVAEHA